MDDIEWSKFYDSVITAASAIGTLDPARSSTLGLISSIGPSSVFLPRRGCSIPWCARALSASSVDLGDKTSNGSARGMTSGSLSLQANTVNVSGCASQPLSDFSFED